MWQVGRPATATFYGLLVGHTQTFFNVSKVVQFFDFLAGHKVAQSRCTMRFLRVCISVGHDVNYCHLGRVVRASSAEVI